MDIAEVDDIINRALLISKIHDYSEPDSDPASYRIGGGQFR